MNDYIRHFGERVALKGRNWQYQLAHGLWLLRNVGSTDPRFDGWWISADNGSTQIMPATALAILRSYRESR